MASTQRPAKRAKLLSDASDSAESEDEKPVTSGFQVNEEFAKRFEHNKKREELQRLEEKYPTTKARSGEANLEEQDEDDDSESDESEDDEAELATRDVDLEILATLQAIKSKDPRVYDQNVKFYKDTDGEASGENGEARKEKAIYLHDYHRQNLLAGYADIADDDAEAVPRSYQAEQEEMRRELAGSMHAAVAGSGHEADNGSDDDFLIAKTKTKHDTLQSLQITDEDVATADKDPETYLSNFMAARAWVGTPASRWTALESDDSDDEERADAFEEAFNLRFEDPAAANETLKHFSRDVGKYSVRRDEKNRRGQARERESGAKEAAKREREEERKRLRKLKIEEAEEKVQRIKEAAGLLGKEIDLESWRDVIDGDFDDEAWQIEMKRRFGDQYYAEDEGADASDEEVVTNNKKGKVKKPKWNDDIDINDLVPDFEKNDDRPAFTLSSDDEEARADLSFEGNDENIEVAGPFHKLPKTKRDRLKAKSDAKRVARKERRQIEDLVDASLPIAYPTLTPSAPARKTAPPVGFHYRETSPTSFGLTAKDILFADDTQLNQFAGLKKLASFRDAEKKGRDRKKFSKKQRLREWRKEVFGSKDGMDGYPALATDGVGQAVEGGNVVRVAAMDGVRAIEKSKKRKRTGKKEKRKQVEGVGA